MGQKDKTQWMLSGVMTIFEMATVVIAPVLPNYTLKMVRMASFVIYISSQ